MTELQKQVGQRLREYRNAKGYSIEELAHIADMNAVHLAALERGEKNFTISTFEKVVISLDISFAEVFSFQKEIDAPVDPLIQKSASLLTRLSDEDKQFVFQTIQHLERKQSKK